jgi:hypothetical protein
MIRGIISKTTQQYLDIPTWTTEERLEIATMLSVFTRPNIKEPINLISDIHLDCSDTPGH